VLKIEFRQLVELLGFIGVIASMIFVGLELRQAQEIAIAGQYQARATNQQEAYLTGLEIAQDEAEIRTTQVDLMLSFFDNAHFQYELGYITEESWQAFKNRMTDLFRNEGPREYFATQKSYYRVSFVEVVDSLLEIESE